MGAFLALSPTLHPWYVCWIVPSAAVRVREPGSAAWPLALPFLALLVRGALPRVRWAAEARA